MPLCLFPLFVDATKPHHQLDLPVLAFAVNAADETPPKRHGSTPANSSGSLSFAAAFAASRRLFARFEALALATLAGDPGADRGAFRS
jgi:hypothetical protein